MRFRLAWVFLFFGVLIAGCGGGGKSGIVPVLNSGSGGNSSPTSGKTTHANIALYIPPASKQAASRKPFYISPNTQSFGVYVEPYPSVAPSIGPSTSPPPGLQIFPVTTPSPCAAATGGGYTCTLTVTAPVGTDLFVVAAFAAASPNPNAGPLSVFVSGPVVVSLSPSPGAAPLAFTLNGVVDSVAVAVNSPDPGNTPNTQVFTVGVATVAPIVLTAYDSSGNQVMSPATLPYFNPIVIQASPAADGLTLSLAGTSACGSSASGATAAINCAGDLGDVQVAYDGTPRPDAGDHLIDAYAVYATNAPNPSPSPANFVLQSNIENFSLGADVGYVSPGFLMRAATGKFVYIVDLYDSNEWELGTFDPSTGTSTAPVQLTTASYLVSTAVAPNGDVWVDDGGPIDCYSESGGPASVSGLYPVVPASGHTIWPSALTVDTAGNLWWVGYDETTYQMYAGYFNVSAGCAATVPSPFQSQFTLSGDNGNGEFGDESPNLSPIPTGGVVMGTGPDTTSGIYIITTAGPSTIAPIPPVLAGAFSTYGVAGDNAGNVYAGFWLDPGSPDIEKLASGGTSLNALLYLPPSPSPPPFPYPAPSGGLNVFSASGAADRAMYAEEDYAALGIVESVASSPMPILVSLPTAVSVYATIYNKNGGEYALNSDTSLDLNLTRALPTRTWSVANLNITTLGCAGTTALLTVLERGDSGPFTVTIPAADGTATQFPGADHDFLLQLVSGTGSFQAQVTDAHGRTEPFTITTTQDEIECGIAHRRLTKHH